MLRDLSRLFSYILLAPLLFGCIAGFQHQNDKVKNVNRIILTQEYQVMERRSPMLHMEQTVIKEIHPQLSGSYEVYDLLVLTENTFPLENELFWVIDNEAFAIWPEFVESNKSFDISESTKRILTADSSSVTVVTGYTQYARKKVQVKYALDPSIIAELDEAQELFIRYYAGPEMITLKVKGFELKKLKMLAEEK